MPACAKAVAVAAPIPRDAPVMRAVLPASEFIRVAGIIPVDPLDRRTRPTRQTSCYTLTSNTLTMRLTSKGQVTIPQAVRDRLGLTAGTEVEFEVVGDAVRVRKAARQTRGRALVERLRGAATTRLTTDEILKHTRG